MINDNFSTIKDKSSENVDKNGKLEIRKHPQRDKQQNIK